MPLLMSLKPVCPNQVHSKKLWLKDKTIWKSSFYTHRGSFCWGDSPSQGRWSNMRISWSLSVFPAVFFVFVALILCSIIWQFTFLSFPCTLCDLSTLQDLSVSIFWSGFQYICLLLVCLTSGQQIKHTLFPTFTIGPDPLTMFWPYLICRAA